MTSCINIIGRRPFEKNEPEPTETMVVRSNGLIILYQLAYLARFFLFLGIPATGGSQTAFRQSFFAGAFLDF